MKTTMVLNQNQNRKLTEKTNTIKCVYKFFLSDIYDGFILRFIFLQNQKKFIYQIFSSKLEIILL